jgi:CNT family concentrative nucleoside transporter
LQLLLNILAMLIVLVALVTMVNLGLAVLPTFNGAPVSLERGLGFVMAPLTWLAGVPWAEAQTAGALMGVKTVLNEFVAYLQLAQLPVEELSPRSRVIMTYALCGFANFGSLGIMLGGLTAMVPERRDDIVALGMRSIISGTLATLVTAAAVGVVL